MVVGGQWPVAGGGPRRLALLPPVQGEIGWGALTEMRRRLDGLPAACKPARVIGSIRHKALRDYWTRGQAKGPNAGWIRKLRRILTALEAADGRFFGPWSALRAARGAAWSARGRRRGGKGARHGPASRRESLRPPCSTFPGPAPVSGTSVFPMACPFPMPCRRLSRPPSSSGMVRNGPGWSGMVRDGPACPPSPSPPAIRSLTERPLPGSAGVPPASREAAPGLDPRFGRRHPGRHRHGRGSGLAGETRLRGAIRRGRLAKTAGPFGG